MCGIWQLFTKISTLTELQINQLIELFNNSKNRGLDSHNFLIYDNYITGFHRLSINGLNPNGMQPFTYETSTYKYSIICNGEIYNHHDLEQSMTNFTNISGSDCEFILPFLSEICGDDIEMLVNRLNGEFAFVIVREKILNGNVDEFDVFLSTDPMSVRPLFYVENYDKNVLMVSSTLNSLDLNGNVVLGNKMEYEINRLKQGTIVNYKIKNNIIILKNEIQYYNFYSKNLAINDLNENLFLFQLIVDTFTSSIIKRITNSDRPIGLLNSGGLDSSLVCAVASKYLQLTNNTNKIKTFTIGFEGGTDLHYARLVASHVNSIHTEIIKTPDEALSNIERTINVCGTYDITSIRASIWQLMIAEYIANNTDIKVLLTGEGSDEICGGYMYFHNAPNEEEAHLESLRLVRNIAYFDGLRADRCVSNFNLELRTPFQDKNFVNLFASINPKFKQAIEKEGRMEKYLLRKAFDVVYKDEPILPEEVLWRRKEAFSDGTSQKEKSWFEMTQEYCKNKVSIEEYNDKVELYSYHNKPFSIEGYYYRKIFTEYFGHKSALTIPYIWMPKWSNTNDPSARTLKIYK